MVSLLNLRIIIIIPIYNEVDVIENTIRAIFSEAQQATDLDIGILIFDSHSNDGSQVLIFKLQTEYKNLYFASEPQKSGLGSSYLQAFHKAIDDLKADIVFEFDADGSHQPKYLLPMIRILQAEADVVVGSRYIKGGSIPKDWGFHRKILSIGGNFIARLFLTRRYHDFTSGFRGTRVEILKKILPKQFLSNQYAYKLELFWLLHQAGAYIREYPIEFIDREKGYSKFPRNNLVDSLRVVLSLRFSNMQHYISMCAVGLLGGILQLTIFNIFRHFTPSLYANMFAVECAILNNFFLNNRLTFRTQRIIEYQSILVKLIQFNLFSLLSLVIQTFILKIGLDLLGYGFWVENFLVILGMALGSITNYFSYSRYIWKN